MPSNRDPKSIRNQVLDQRVLHSAIGEATPPSLTFLVRLFPLCRGVAVPVLFCRAELFQVDLLLCCYLMESIGLVLPQPAKPCLGTARVRLPSGNENLLLTMPVAFGKVITMVLRRKKVPAKQCFTNEN